MAADGVVANPTYMADIRFFFRPMDISHMAEKNIDLSTYDGVRKRALEVYFITKPPDAEMPPDGPWSADRWQTFRNWIANGYPLGTATAPAARPELAPEAAPERLRKDVTTLGDPEIAKLKSAFEGLMSRDPDASNSYYAIAGVHGLPGSWCLHHDDPFNPWHRVYMRVFEDALRSVRDCEDVTMPYWDFETPLPALLNEAPFASYTLPKNPGGDPPYYPYTTKRYDAATITKNMQQHGVFEEIAASLRQSMWGDYNTGGYQKFSMQAHDAGHYSIGRTMREQDIASYDPVFWFFHCNIDRLWLSWQQKVGATTLQGFKSTLTGDTEWLTAPFNGLPPYETTSDQTIAFDIGYDKLASVDEEAAALENKLGSVEARRRVSIKRSSPVSVRIKDIERLNIPGSFSVILLADGEPIARRAFFQPKSPRDCKTCVKIPRVNIDFRLDPEKVLDRTLSVEIEVPRHEEIGARFPLAQAGNPTINARLLLDEE